jgi:hypothetical protein
MQPGLRHGGRNCDRDDFGRGPFVVVVSGGHGLPVGETLMNFRESQHGRAFLDGASTNE